MLRFTNIKLRGMDSNSNSTGPGIQIVAGKGDLATFIQASTGCQRKRMGRNNHSIPECLQCIRIQ